MFDPAADFLLELQWVNLFEPVSADPAAFPRYRCKGCREMVSMADRARHHRTHKRQEQRRRESQIRQKQLANMAKARAARKLKAA